MIRQRYPTRRPVRRLLSNRWMVAVLVIAALLTLPAIAEAACNAIGMGYDPRIGQP